MFEHYMHKVMSMRVQRGGGGGWGGVGVGGIKLSMKVWNERGSKIFQNAIC